MRKFQIGMLCAVLLSMLSCSKQDDIMEAEKGNVSLTLQLDYTAEEKLSGGRIRSIVRAYPVKGRERAKEHVAEMLLIQDMDEGYDYETTWELPQGDYEIMVWSDLMEAGAAVPFYNADNFGEITLQGRHAGSNDYRDAYRGTASVSLQEGDDRQIWKVEMQSSLAKFEIVANDLLQFVDKETERTSGSNSVLDINTYTAVFQYVGFMPNAFSMFTDKPVDATTGVTFQTSLKALSETEASLGFDYVFVSSKESVVTIRVGILDSEGTVVMATNAIRVPLFRGETTVLKGEYLMQKNSGGIQVNPDYEGDYNWVIP